MIKCLVIDDEPLAIDILTDYIKKVDFLQLVKTFQNPLEAITLVNNGDIDLIFLDVQMPQISGLQFLKMVDNRTKIILTTAYSQYAVDGFTLEVIDYLLKPIAFERFYKAALKAQSIFLNIKTGNSVETLKDEKKQQAVSDFIFVKTEHKIQKVQIAEICFIEGLKDYISIYTQNDRIITLQSMKKMEEILPAENFMRVHKSYIVCIDKIKSIERGRITIGEKIIPIGDTYRDLFFEKIKFKNI